jgi:hypothetical protein
MSHEISFKLIRWIDAEKGAGIDPQATPLPKLFPKAGSGAVGDQWAISSIIRADELPVGLSP